MSTIAGKGRSILLKVIPYVALVMVAKLVLHYFGWEIISINSIFSGIIGATIFLLGFLLSGVMSDFKESEKIPSEIASILHTITDEIETTYNTRKDSSLIEGMELCRDIGTNVKSWFHKKKKSRDLMEKIHSLYHFYLKLEGLIPANYIVRLKQEQHNLRKIMMRTHVIRETSFISSGYLIASSSTILLLAGLVLAKIEPFYESLFFLGVVSYLMIFLIMLINDLDNPFGYYESDSSEDVSLKPLDDFLYDIEARLAEIKNCSPKKRGE